MSIYDANAKKWKPACMLKPENDKSSIKYYCPRHGRYKKKNSFLNSWIFCRPTFGWTCGVHADYAKFKTCFKNSRNLKKLNGTIHYITLLRDPLIRYISEWYHVTRSIKKFQIYSPFNTSTNICNKEVSMLECIPKKLENNTVTLEDFNLCVNNIAINRQTRLLADYNYNEDGCNLFSNENKRLLLENAKNVLNGMSFFGLTEYEELNQKLFEKTFQNIFKFDYKIDPKMLDQSSSVKAARNLSSSMVKEIKKLNDLDVELYEYAKKLYFERLNFFNITH